MRMRVFLAVSLLCMVSAPSIAETYGEKIKAVDADKKTLTIPVDGKDKTLRVADKVDVVSQIRSGKRLRVTPIKEGLKGIKAGAEATITTEKRDGEEVVTKVVVLVVDSKSK